jgi:hypothetical protein
MFACSFGGVSICGFMELLFACRYFLRKLKKVKKSNGQMLAINEVLSSYHDP